MKPFHIPSRIFLDSGDPQETKDIVSTLGFLDGQTTNPTLIARHPTIAQQLERGEKLSPKEALAFYKRTAQEIYAHIPKSSISLEVYADEHTSAEDMVRQGKDLAMWLPSAHVKLPTTREGIQAGQELLAQGIAINMTLCFSQEQAAALVSAFGDVQKDMVYVSPFVGRLDDRGENGMDVVQNILTMYKTHGSHIQVLAASIRHYAHFLHTLSLQTDIVTAPAKILKEWDMHDMEIPHKDAVYEKGALKEIPYQDIDVSLPWETLYADHPLTQAGIAKFAQDWNSFVDTDV